MSVDAYKAMKETIESPDESVPFENVLNVAMLHVRKPQNQSISALRSYSLFFCLDISLLVISFVVQVDAV